MADYYDPNKQTPGIPPALADLYGNDGLGQFLQGPNAPAQAPSSIGAPAPMAPPVNPQAQPMLSALTNPQPQTGDINIDGWKPHHTTVLGKIADIGLALFGLPILPFTNHVKRENLNEAMEGFTTDPLNSIRRLAQIPGMQDKAWKLFENYQQIHENDAIDAQKLEYYKDMNEDRVRGLLSSYLGGIKSSSNPEANYQKLLPQLKGLASSRGMTQDAIDALLPDKYDPDLAQTVLVGGVKPADQVRIGETQDYHKSQEQLHQEEINQTGQYRNARLGQINQHEAAYEGHNSVMENIASGREARLATNQKKAGFSYVNTQYGPGEINNKNPDAMRVQVGDTNHFYTRVGPNKWRHVKSSPVDTKKNPSVLTNSGTPYDDSSDDSEDDN